MGIRDRNRATTRIATATTIAVLALLSVGCPPAAVYQTADTLEPGAWQVGGGAGVVGLRDVEQDTRVPGGDLEVFARRGIAPDLDVGLRLYTAGLEGSVKWRFQHETWSVAIMPGLAVLRTKETNFTTNAWHGFATLPLLASRRLSRRWSVSVGPKAMGGVYDSTASGPQFGLGLGGFALAALHLGNFRLMPEVDLTRMIAGDVPVDGWLAHVGVGLSWQR